MPLLSEDQIAAAASRKRETYRAGRPSQQSSVAVKWRTLSALLNGASQQRGEFIRHLILDELTRDNGEPTASAELSEIVGIRLMLMNVLKPIAAGQKITRKSSTAS